MADLSEEKGQSLFLSGLLLGLICIGMNTGRVYICTAQSLSGSNDQTIDNIQRTMGAYLELGSDSQRAIKLWGNKLISSLDPYHLN